jgi:methionyl-tRNA formyltransferase
MKILLLGPYRSEMIDFIASYGDEVITTEAKITSDLEFLLNTDLIVSYGYRHILKSDVLNNFQRKVINIHISLLPWNKGSDPNLWSFLENTPKGVTIHYVDSGIDTGEIIVQEQVDFSDSETLRTSYEKLSQTAIALFKENWISIRDGKIKSTPQLGSGSHHRQKDRISYEHLLTHGWDTPVSQIIGKAKESK